MSVKKGYLRYKYTIKIDIEDLADRIIKELGGYVDEYEVETDDTAIILNCTDTAYYRHYHSPATILDPPEDDLCLDSIEDVDVTAAVLDALHETQKIKVDVDMGTDYHFMGD